MNKKNTMILVDKKLLSHLGIASKQPSGMGVPLMFWLASLLEAATSKLAAIKGVDEDGNYKPLGEDYQNALSAWLAAKAYAYLVPISCVSEVWDIESKAFVSLVGELNAHLSKLNA